MIGWIPLELCIWGWTDKKGLDKLKSLKPDVEHDVERMEPTKAHSSEFFYDVEYDLKTTIRLDEPKLEVYAVNLQSIMSDMVAAIDDPSHKLHVTIEDAIEAVRVAEMATKGMCVGKT